MAKSRGSGLTGFSSEERTDARTGNYKSWNETERQDEMSHFQGEVDRWRDKMSANEEEAVATYTGSSYQEINDYLRNDKYGTGDDKYYEQLIRQCDNGLKKFRLNENIEVHRRSTDDLLRSLNVRMSDFIDDWGDLDKTAYVNEIKTRVGSLVHDKAFMSTSTQRDTWSGSVHYIIRVPRGSSGAYVEHISRNAGEREFLLNRGTRLRVDGAEVVGGYPTVTLTVVGRKLK